MTVDGSSLLCIFGVLFPFIITNLMNEGMESIESLKVEDILEQQEMEQSYMRDKSGFIISGISAALFMTIGILAELIILQKVEISFINVNEKSVKNMVCIAGYISIFCGVWSIVGCIVHFLLYNYDNDSLHRNFLSYSLSKNAYYFKAGFALFFTGYAFLLYNANPTLSNQPSAGNTTDIAPVGRDLDTLGIFTSLILTISLMIVLYGLKRMLLQLIRYNMHCVFYEERIRQTNENMQILSKFNVNIKLLITCRDYSELGERVFEGLLRRKSSVEKDCLMKEDFVLFLGEQLGEAVFIILDRNKDSMVVRKEFVRYFESVYHERMSLIAALFSSKGSIEKLDTILNVLYFMLFIFLVFSSSGYGSSFKQWISWISGIVLPLSFIFAGVVADIFKSIIFVFAIRPFDINDTIIVSEKKFVVIKIGFLSCSFGRDGKTYCFTTSSLGSNPIVNLRKSKYIIEKFSFKCDILAFQSIQEEFEATILTYLNDNRTYYGSNYELSFEGGSLGELDVAYVKVPIYYDQQKDIAYNEKRDKFLVFLKSALKDIKIV